MAVVLTSDTTRFDAGFAKAGTTVRRFHRQVDSSGMPLLNLAKASGAARAALGGLNGNVLGAVGGLSKLGTGGVIAAAVVGLGLLTKRAIEARDALAVSRGEQSIATAWAQVKTQLSSVLASLAEITGLHTAARNAAQAWAHDLKQVADSLKTDEMRKQDAFWKRRTEFMKEQKRLAEELAAADKKGGERMARFFDDMRGRAERISTSLRTPAEIFADTVNELNALIQLGAVNLETYNRGVSKAKADLAAAAKSAAATAKSFRDISYTPVAAVDRHSGGFSAAMQARFEMDKLAKLQEQELAVAKEAKRIQEEGFRKLLNKEPIVFQRGNL